MSNWVRTLSLFAFEILGVALTPLRWWQRIIFRPQVLRRVLINMAAEGIGIGDLIQVTPLLRALREVAPRVEITLLLTKSRATDIVHRFPVAVDVIEIPSGQYCSQSQREWLSFVWYTIRPRRFDLIVHQYLEWSWMPVAYLSLFGGSLQIMGYPNFTRNLWRNTLNTLPLVYRSAGLQPFDYNAQMSNYLKNTGPWKPSLNYPDGWNKAFRELELDGWLKPREAIMGLHPGCIQNNALRRWPLDRFAEVAKRFCYDSGGKVLVFGGPDEQAEATEIEKRIGTDWAKAIIGQPLGRVVALITGCTLFLTNDSGLMHTSMALGVPTIAIFGPTNVKTYQHLYPKGTFLQAKIECGPCYGTARYAACGEAPLPCLRAISADAVYQAVSDLLHKKRVEL